MNKNKKGFTLVELLAVIVILAIILAIAIPSITGLIDSQRESAFESNIKMIIKGVEYKLLEEPGHVIDADSVAPYGGDDTQFNGIYIRSVDGVITIDAKAASDGKFAGYCTIEATYNSVTIVDAATCTVGGV